MSSGGYESGMTTTAGDAFFDERQDFNSDGVLNTDDALPGTEESFIDKLGKAAPDILTAIANYGAVSSKKAPMDLPRYDVEFPPLMENGVIKPSPVTYNPMSRRTK